MADTTDYKISWRNSVFYDKCSSIAEHSDRLEISTTYNWHQIWEDQVFHDQVVYTNMEDIPYVSRLFSSIMMQNIST